MPIWVSAPREMKVAEKPFVQWSSVNCNHRRVMIKMLLQNFINLVWLEGWKSCRAQWISKWPRFIPGFVFDWMRQLTIWDSFFLILIPQNKNKRGYQSCRNEEEYIRISLDFIAIFKLEGVLVKNTRKYIPLPLMLLCRLWCNVWLQS